VGTPVFRQITGFVYSSADACEMQATDNPIIAYSECVLLFSLCTFVSDANRLVVDVFTSVRLWKHTHTHTHTHLSKSCRPRTSSLKLTLTLILLLPIEIYLHTWCGLSANLRRRSETCCTWLAEIQDAKMSPKIAIWAPSHNFVGLYLRN